MYGLLYQTVTVYHQGAIGSYTRTVHAGAFFDFKKTQSVDKTGSREANDFLLVVKGDTQTVFVGDKVMHGEGPVIETREDWAQFIPAKVPGLAVVSYADPKYFKGVMVHTEAGG